jgi:hypothetical protein
MIQVTDTRKGASFFSRSRLSGASSLVIAEEALKTI